MSTPDPRYIPAFSINTIITNKDDAYALANGTVEFYSDTNRLQDKQVYRLAGYPNYYFEPLGSTLTLSSIGTFVDQDGDPVVPYFLPYNTAGEEERYYIKCYSEGGVFQFDREAVPYLPSSTDVERQTEFTSINQVSNPQFVEKLFQGTNYTYTVSGNQVTPIAPGWELVTTGSGTVQVQQLSNIAATEPTSPPFAIQLLSSGLASSYELRQRIYQSPKLFYQKYVSSSFVISVSVASDIFLRFEPSNGGSYTLNSDRVAATGGFVPQNNVTYFDQLASTDPGTTGYVDLVFDIPAGVTVAITSVQLLTVAASDALIEFQQQGTPQQQSFLYWYDRPGLIYKPIKSYLTGWDFPLNPAQFGSTVAASAIGANKSQYVWDQTILFQSADSGVSVARASGNNALQLTAAVDTQLAIIQYLDEAQARKILNGPMSANISAIASANTNACISLWYTTDASLPDVSSGTNNSIVATLNSNGKPATFNGTWTEVPRSNMGDATFTIGTSATTEFNDYAFTGWDMEGIAAVNTATYFAIVIGTASMTTGRVVTFNSVSLVPGVIPTVPAPQTPDEVIADCQYYYEMSYDGGGTTSPIGGDGTSAIVKLQTAVNSGAATLGYASPFGIQYQMKRTNAPNVTLYAASNATPNYVTVQGWANGAATTGAVDDSVVDFWVETDLGAKGVHYVPTGPQAGTPIISGTPFSNNCSVNLIFHYVVDARLGIV